MDAELDSKTSSYHDYLVFLLCSIIFVYFLTVIWTAYGSPLRSIPGPFIAKFTPLWLFYKTAQFKTTTDYKEWHDKYGPMVRVAPNKVSCADPAMIPVIYKIGSRFHKAPLYDTFKGMYEGRWLDTIFSTRDPHFHKEVRSSVASKYSLASLRQMEPLVDECSDLFATRMQESLGQTVDLGTWVQWYAFDVIGQITFMKQFGFMQNRKDDIGILDNLESGSKFQTVVAQLPGLNAFIFGHPLLQRLLNKIPALVKANPIIKVLEILEMAMAEYDKTNDGIPRSDFLGFLRAAQEKDPNRYTDRQIISNLSVNIFAGSDTTGASLRAIFYYLMKNPLRYQRLMAEIDAADEARKLSTFVTFEESNNLPYLQAVIKESLRLSPAVGIPLERLVPPEGATISDHFLPGNSVIGINAWVVHRSSLVYGPDPDAFRPERWLVCESEHVDSANTGIDVKREGSTKSQLQEMEKAFFSFGAGNRVCLGKNISMLEMCKFVPQMLRRFEMEWVGPNGDGTGEWDVKGQLLVKQHGVFVRMREREKMGNGKGEVGAGA